jgi:hypothetical protein
LYNARKLSHTSKDYAISLIELLKRDDAIEDLELPQFELSESQKAAIDKEIYLIANNPNYLQNWEDIKQRFKES